MKKILFYSVLIFMFSIGIGYFYSSLWKKNNIGKIHHDIIENEIVIKETIAVEEKIGHNASFALKKYYKSCGHFKFNYSELPHEIINLSKDELEKLYPDWNVEEFSSNNIVLSQNLDEMCDEHFILKLEEDSIDIYQMKNKEEYDLYKTTNISKEYLTSNDINTLEKGIFVYGKGNLNSAIEDFE